MRFTALTNVTKVDEQTGYSILQAAVIAGDGDIIDQIMPFCLTFDIEPDNYRTTFFQQTKVFKSRLMSRAMKKLSGTRSQISKLQIAVCSSNVEKVIQLVCEENQEVNDSGDIGIRPLAVAAAVGNLEMVQTLIDLGAEIDAQDEHCRTALYYAVARKNIKAAHLLLKHGANPSRFVDLLNNSVRKPKTRSVVKNLCSITLTRFSWKDTCNFCCF